MNILRIVLDGEEYPHYTLSKAFEKNFGADNVHTIWWQKYKDLNELNNLIINTVETNNYDAVFMQLQMDGVINEEAAKAINKYSLGFNWTGDVRTNIDWYIRMGKYFITLFTNTTDISKMHLLGLKADYLQIGYDDKYYFPKESICHNNIVFCANYYPESDYPLTSLRKDVVYALKREFGDKFNLYGNNWNKCGINAELPFVGNYDEAEIYRTAAIAINCSHFNYGRYSSDRLLREMASGAFVLTHNYKDLTADFKDGEHLVSWDNIPDLIKKCHYYLENEAERKRIALAGNEYVQRHCNWMERLKDFRELIHKYQKISAETVHGTFI